MIVKHPVIEGVQYDVPDASVQSWIDSGWVAEGAPAVAVEPPQQETTVGAPVNTRKKD
jgi:hypothetical protein